MRATLRGAYWLLAALVAVSLLAASAVAQPPGGGPGGRGGGPGGRGGPMGGRGGGADIFALLRIEKVQEEIKLTSDQKSQLTQLAEQQAQELRDQFSGFRDLSQEEREQRMSEMRTKMEERAATVQKKVGSILSADQIKRLKEIGIQVQGVRALQNPEVVSALKITEAQQEEMREVENQAREQRQGQFGGSREEFQNMTEEERRARFEQMRESFRTAQTELEQKVLAVLTSTQRDQFEKMKGEKFELDMAELFRGRGGPGGQAGPGGPGGPGGRRGGDRGGDSGGRSRGGDRGNGGGGIDGLPPPEDF